MKEKQTRLPEQPGQTETLIHHCSHCHRLLPVAGFYVNRRTGRVDGICKECRQEYSRLRRKQAALSTGGNTRILTLMPPGKERHELLHQVLLKVRERVLQSRRRKWEDDWDN